MNLLDDAFDVARALRVRPEVGDMVRLKPLPEQFSSYERWLLDLLGPSNPGWVREMNTACAGLMEFDRVSDTWGRGKCARVRAAGRGWFIPLDMLELA